MVSKHPSQTFRAYLVELQDELVLKLSQFSRGIEPVNSVMWSLSTLLIIHNCHSLPTNTSSRRQFSIEVLMVLMSKGTLWNKEWIPFFSFLNLFIKGSLRRGKIMDNLPRANFSLRRGLSLSKGFPYLLRVISIERADILCKPATPILNTNHF